VTIFFAGKNVLELGCGAALPSILSLRKGAVHSVVQDFNGFVIERFTVPNFHLNQVGSEQWRGFSARWDSCMDSDDVPAKSFDLILTSETIYNQSNYASLHAILDRALKQDGKILMAAKRYYFGLSASLSDFEV